MKVIAGNTFGGSEQKQRPDEDDKQSSGEETDGSSGDESHRISVHGCAMRPLEDLLSRIAANSWY